jgi:hypothetical protein
MINTFWYIQFTFSSVRCLRFRTSTVPVFARDLFVLELETDQFRLAWRKTWYLTHPARQAPRRQDRSVRRRHAHAPGPQQVPVLASPPASASPHPVHRALRISATYPAAASHPSAAEIHICGRSIGWLQRRSTSVAAASWRS